MVTNYSKAWKEFQESVEYKMLVVSMEKQGIKRPWSENILQAAFAAGWCSTDTNIIILES
jgi:hypothetical protein